MSISFTRLPNTVSGGGRGSPRHTLGAAVGANLECPSVAISKHRQRPSITRPAPRATVAASVAGAQPAASTAYSADGLVRAREEYR